VEPKGNILFPAPFEAQVGLVAGFANRGQIGRGVSTTAGFLGHPWENASKALHSNELPHTIDLLRWAWHASCFFFVPSPPAKTWAESTKLSEGPSAMKQALKEASSRQEVVSKDFSDLASAVASLPGEYRARLEPLMERAIENSTRRRRILNLVQDALGQLRLDMKYLMFDLEATRRERDEYRRKLGEDEQQ
jgi:hypothetical protein